MNVKQAKEMCSKWIKENAQRYDEIIESIETMTLEEVAVWMIESEHQLYGVGYAEEDGILITGIEDSEIPGTIIIEQMRHALRTRR